MKQRNIRPYRVRIFHAALTGQILTALGVVTMLQAHVGLEPWSVLQEGMSQTFGISFGTASMIVGAVVILLAVLMGESIGIGTLFCVFLTGPFIDGIQTLGIIPTQSTLLPGLIQLLIGMELLVLGTYFYMREGLGQGSRDALMVALAKKTGRTSGFCRSAVEAASILIGWLLGGTVGIGTVVAMIGIGILIDLTFRIFHFNPTAIEQEHLLKTWEYLHNRFIP